MKAVYEYFARHKKGVVITLIILLVLVLFIGSQVAWIMWYGQRVPRPNITSAPQVTGVGPALSYVVMGDSTAVSQGGTYAKGYAVASAQHLAQHHTVTLVNVAVPGARAKDVATLQIAEAMAAKPDVVLIAVGANDVTHFTPLSSVRSSLQSTIAKLKQANSNVRIVLTGSPDMGGPPRLPQPLRTLAGARSVRINREVLGLVDNRTSFFAPIAEKTGPTFRTHHELFAADHFHPTDAGYQLWIPVVNTALDKATQ